MMIQVDPDWEKAFEDNSTFWFIARTPSLETTLHCNFQVRADKSVSPTSTTLKDLSTNGLSITFQKHHHSLNSSIKKNGSEQLHHSSQSPFTKANLHKGYTNCMHSTQSLILTGHPDGGLFVFDVHEDIGKPNLIRTLKGHVTDVNTVRFFPSGTVVLSGGGDMILKIWTLIEDGQCVAELKGHKRGILSSDLVERGRNIVSSSRDGTAILWDVPTQTKIYSWGDGVGAVNQCRLAHHTASGGDPIDPRDVGTDGKLLLLGSESGKVQGYDLCQRKEVFSIKTQSPVNAVVGLPQSNYILSGEQNGTVTCWDKRNMLQEFKKISLHSCHITKLLENNSDHCWIGCGNGLVYLWALSTDDVPSSSLISDTEPINDIVQRKANEVVTLSRRGFISVYSVGEN